MAYRVSMDELGIVNDHTVFEGQTPGDVWRRVREHLNDKHNIKLPELEEMGDNAGVLPILPRFDTGAAATQQGPVGVVGGRIEGEEDSEAAVIATRVIEKLHVGQQGSGSSDIVPPGGTQSPMP